MKIIDFKRSEDQSIVAVLEDKSEVTLAWDYVMDKKPQVGDEFAVEAKEKPAKKAASK